MVQHIVLLKWKPGVSEEAILQAFDHGKHLPNEIDGVEHLAIGRRPRRSGPRVPAHAVIVSLGGGEALGPLPQAAVR